MRRARIKAAVDEGEAVYHLISRTVNGEWLLGVEEKEVLRRLMRQVADFAGIEVITFVILSNHFHFLVRVPQKAPVSDEELLRRYAVLYPHLTKSQSARLEVIRAQLPENGPLAVAWRQRLLSQMNDVSPYMKLVKERYSMWHNRRHGRFGPVWSDRFKSLLAESKCRAIETMAMYIDLNCVRAGLATDPKDYRYCGYADAVAGREDAQRGLRTVVGGSSWPITQAAYRQLLFATGSAPREGAASIPLDRVRQVMREGGKLLLADVLRCRVRYFSQGAVIGSRAFVETHLANYRRRYGGGQRMKVRPLPALADWGELAGLRRYSGEFFG